MKPLIAQELFDDPRIEDAKKLLLSAIDDAQKKFVGVRGADPERRVIYEELLAAFKEARGSDLYYPYIGSGVGKGALVELEDGSIKYDFICGIGPHYFGHTHPGLVKAAIDSAITDTVMQGNLQQNVEPLKLMQKLISTSGLKHCFLSTSGAMATENGLKIAFHYKKSASRVLAFEGCFMGRTMTLSQITDKAQYRKGLPLTLGVDYLPFYDPQKPQESKEHAVKMLKKYIARYPGQHAAMCFELIQGEGGIRVGSRPFFLQLMECLKEHDIPIIADEVQSFGRTPSLYAFRYFELENFVDIVTIGKVSLVCATLFSEKMNPTPGLLSQTFTASSSAIKGSIYLLEELINGNFYGKEGKIAKNFDAFEKRFKDLEKKHPGKISGPYGIGSMIAFTPFKGEATETLAFAKKLYDNGLITFLAGQNPTRIRMLPPVPALTEKDLDLVFEIIDKTFTEIQIP